MTTGDLGRKSFWRILTSAYRPNDRRRFGSSAFKSTIRLNLDLLKTFTRLYAFQWVAFTQHSPTSTSPEAGQAFWFVCSHKPAVCWPDVREEEFRWSWINLSSFEELLPVCNRPKDSLGRSEYNQTNLIESNAQFSSSRLKYDVWPGPYRPNQTHSVASIRSLLFFSFFFSFFHQYDFFQMV